MTRTSKPCGLVCGLVVLASSALACEHTSLPNEGAGGMAGAASAGAGGAGNPIGGAASAGGGMLGVSGNSTAGAAAGTGGAASGGGPALGGSSGAGSGGATGGGGDATGGGGGGIIKSAGCAAPSWPTSKAGYSIDVDGTSRSYILRIPDDYDTNRPYRLIIAFHWLNGTADNVANGNNGATGKPFYGLWELAQGSTIFVAPQGIDNGWPDSGRNDSSGGRDIEFTAALLQELTSKLCIDESRIFAEGFSMGGSMSYAVACAMGKKIRGVAVHSGGPMSGCVEHDEPVPYFMSHGTNDGVCTYPQYGVPQLDDFAELNGCMDQALPTPTGNGTPSCVDFSNCDERYPARACIFVGDHTPSPPNPSNTWVPAETWKFFTQF